MFCEGAGAADDPAKIAGWFEQAAASGDLVAAFNLGICLTKGVGVEQDEQQAAQWLRRAAEGVPDAQYMYGRMLAEGRGVTPDLKEARTWFKRAAEAGMPDAQVALAEMMVNGRGGPRDLAGAVELFEKAAAQGHSGAMFALGALHGGGHGLADGPASRPTLVPRGGRTWPRPGAADARPLSGKRRRGRIKPGGGAPVAGTRRCPRCCRRPARLGRAVAAAGGRRTDMALRSGRCPDCLSN